MCKFLFVFLLSLSSVAYSHAEEEMEVMSVQAELVSDYDSSDPADYEIVIMDESEEFYDWAEELWYVDEPTEDATVEEVMMYDMVNELMPEFRVVPTGPRAMRRTCAALEQGASSGQASWYGGRFHGRKTANGETYNQNGLTAAHKTLPFNSIVEVTYRGRKVRVRINDAGPYHGRRIIDLSREAARQLGMLDAGVGEVSLTLISCGGK